MKTITGSSMKSSTVEGDVGIAFQPALKCVQRHRKFKVQVKDTYRRNSERTL